MARYDSPAKRELDELLFAIARQTDCQSYATFWGFGVDSRRATELGFDVTACEIREAKHDAGSADAARVGYRFHPGRGSSLGRDVDVFHADFDNTPNPRNFKELRGIASLTRKWLKVTISTDHMRNEEMQGEAFAATIPAWLTFAAQGFTLEYLGRYVRNSRGLVMWVAILQRRGGRGVSHAVQPIQVARSIGERGYWASRPMYQTGLMTHRQEPRTPITRAGDARRYQEKKAQRPRTTRVCRHCEVLFVVPLGQGRRPGYCSKSCQKLGRSDYRKRWYQERVAAVSGTAAKPSVLEEAA